MMFFMSFDSINVLMKYHKLFEDKGLCRIYGQNVTVTEKEIVSLFHQLMKRVLYLMSQCAHRSDKLFSA